MTLDLVSKVKSFNGFQKVYKHFSKETNCLMKFSVYEPEGQGISTEDSGRHRYHVLFYLSGLTCTEENFIFKSGFQRYASEHKFIVVGPDTSPRGLGIPGESDIWNFGIGAGAYVDALIEPWCQNYRMYSYVTKELPEIIKNNFPTTSRFGIFGHSMGGHGALVCALRNPELFQSVSAFAPITNPIQTEWGKDIAFKKYLGDENRDKWDDYDSCVIAKSYNGPYRSILVDQGKDDEFWDSLLKPNNLKTAISENINLDLNLRIHDGYNHSYYFVATFIADHFQHHAKILNSLPPLSVA